MSEEIDKSTFNHMVELAALELEEEEAEYLRGELNNQLQVIHELEAIPLDEETPATSHGVPYTPEISSELREDKLIPFTNTDGLLDQAPEILDGYIVVPDTLHEDLE